MNDERRRRRGRTASPPPSSLLHQDVVAALARGRCESHIRIEERIVGYHTDVKHTVGVSVLRQLGPSAVARSRSTFLVRK